MSPSYRAAGVRRYYITLIMRACAKGGTGLDPPRSPTRGRKRGTHNERTDEKQGSGKRARDDYRRQRGVLSIPGALSQVLARWPITPRRIDFRGGCYTHQIQPDTITTRSRKKRTEEGRSFHPFVVPRRCSAFSPQPPTTCFLEFDDIRSQVDRTYLSTRRETRRERKERERGYGSA